jgi:hypothetical protein
LSCPPKVGSGMVTHSRQRGTWQDRFKEERARQRGWLGNLVATSPTRRIQLAMGTSAICGLVLVLAPIVMPLFLKLREHARTNGASMELGGRSRPESSRGQAELASALGAALAHIGERELARDTVLNGIVGPRDQPNSSTIGTDLRSRSHRNGIRENGLEAPATNMDGDGGAGSRNGTIWGGQAAALPRGKVFDGGEQLPGMVAAEAPPVDQVSRPASGENELVVDEDGSGWSWYTVVAGDTLTAISERSCVPIDAVLAANVGEVRDADAIVVGQRLRLPNAQGAARAAGVPTAPVAGECNYVVNPSIEEAADDLGLPLAHDDGAHARHARGWRPLDAVVAGEHYIREHAAEHVRSGEAALRVQCLGPCAAQGKGWRGLVQHVVLLHPAPLPVAITAWVSAEALSAGAGIYADVSFAEPSASGGDSSPRRHEWGAGARPASFAKDFTARIPSGTYGWWPVRIDIPPPPAPLAARSLLLYILMRGASGTFWYASAPAPAPAPAPGPRLGRAGRAPEQPAARAHWP